MFSSDEICDLCAEEGGEGLLPGRLPLPAPDLEHHFTGLCFLGSDSYTKRNKENFFLYKFFFKILIFSKRSFLTKPKLMNINKNDGSDFSSSCNNYINIFMFGTRKKVEYFL